VTLASGQPVEDGLVLGGSTVLWSYLDGTSQVVATVGEGGGAVTTRKAGGRIAAADASDLIVVTGGGNAADYGLVRIPVAGGDPVTLVSGVSVIGAVALDESHVYWSTNGSVGDCFSPSCPAPVGAVMSVPRAGGAVVTLASGPFVPSSLSVDATDAYFDQEVDGATTIARVPKGGGAPVAIASVGFVTALRADASSLFWIEADIHDLSPPQLVTVPKSGGKPTKLADVGVPASTALAVDATGVFWIESTTHAILRVPKAGGAAATVTTGVTDLDAIAGDASGVYWTATPPCTTDCRRDVLHIATTCP
jgi:hypothetical protein